MKLLSRATVIYLMMLLCACASKPQIDFDTQKMSSIKTIAVAVPKPTTYFAVSSGGPVFIPIPGASVLAAAIGGAIAGGVAAASNRTNKEFDSLVKDRLGDTRLNRRYVDGLEDELRAQGYQVKEVDLGQAGMPGIDGDLLHPVLKGEPYAEADAIMIAPVKTGYGANGMGCPYVRAVNSQIRIFTANTFVSIFSQNISSPATCPVISGASKDFDKNNWAKSNKGSKEPVLFSYEFYSDLVNDLPHAVQGVDEALMSFVPQFRAALLASKGVSESGAGGQK
jgi:hypothetical protein